MRTTNPKDIKLYSVMEVCNTKNHDTGSKAIFPSQTSNPYSLMKTWIRIKLDNYSKDRWLSPFTYKIVSKIDPYEMLTQPVRYCEHLHYIFLYQFKDDPAYGVYELELCIHETHPTETF